MAQSPLQKHRKSAFNRQNGKCCYCGFQMWQNSAEEFATQHKISVKQAMHFQCTAEHLRARQDGGKDSPLNIAAACKRCNSLRHKRKTAPKPSDYQRFVQKRLDAGGWITIQPTANLTRGKAPRIQ